MHRFGGLTLRSRVLLYGVLAAIGASGCESDKAGGPVNVACTIALNGALTQTLDCSTQVVATWTSANDSTVINGGAQGTAALATYIRLLGVPTAGTFRNTDAGARGFVSASSGSQGWIATTVGMPGSLPASGSWTVVLTSVTESGTTASGKTYTIHGTIDATLPPIGGGANLIAKVTF